MPQYINYEGLTDIVYSLSNNIKLNFTVKLAVPDKYGNRMFTAHKEFEFYGNKYTDKQKVISLKREFDYYLYFSDYSDKDLFVQIRLENMIMIQAVVQTLVNYFLDDSNWGMTKDKRLTIKKKISPMTVDLFMGKWISFEPVVILYEDEAGLSEGKGLRLYLSSDDKYVDLSLNKFMGLAYSLISMNMYQSAITMLNYFDEKKCGSNFVTFNPQPQYQEIKEEERSEVEGVSQAVKDRKPVKKNSKSYFDKSRELDDM
jgi:hypothetical protein